MAFASAGVGSAPHLAGDQLREQANIDILHIPYRGGSAIFTDLLGGQLQFSFGTVPSLQGHIESGALNAIAIASPERVEQLPNVPTFAESGLAGVDAEPFFGLVAPGGTPDAIVTQLSETIAKAMQQGPANEKLKSLGFRPVGTTPAEFAERIKNEIQKWTKVIETAGIQPE